MRIGDSDISSSAPFIILARSNESKFISIGGGGGGKPLACWYRPVQRDRTRKDCLWLCFTPARESCTLGRPRAKGGQRWRRGTDVVGHRRSRFHRVQSGCRP